MKKAATYLVRMIYACKAIYDRKWAFIALTAVIFLVTLVSLAFAGFIPNTHKKVSHRTDIAPTVALTAAPVQVIIQKSHTEYPVKIAIPSIKMSVSIKNPETTNVKIMDEALLSGAVRYPRSALLGEQGNIILFGHSSYLPVIWNQAYKTFDGIQNLHKDARVFAYSSTTVYEYAVDSVEKENTTTGSIALSVSGKTLTLATCNVFGKKSDRFVVTAHFVKSYPIGNNS